jgi:hypothetical protein
MEKLDLQIQIKVIELAEKWTHENLGGVERSIFIKRATEEFDRAYKAIMKTITEQNSGTI